MDCSAPALAPTNSRHLPPSTRAGRAGRTPPLSPADVDDRRRRVKALAEPYGAWSDVVVADRTIEAIAEAGDGDRHRLVCLATHGRDRSAGLAHSVSAGVVAASDGPVLLVGPKVLPEAPASQRLVACVDGTIESESIVPTAIAWAAALHSAYRRTDP